MILEINDDTFESSIRDGICLVDFWAPWCGPCRMLSPVIDELAEEIKDIKVFKCNSKFFCDTRFACGSFGRTTILFISTTD